MDKTRIEVLKSLKEDLILSDEELKHLSLSKTQRLWNQLLKESIERLAKKHENELINEQEENEEER